MPFVRTEPELPGTWILMRRLQRPTESSQLCRRRLEPVAGRGSEPHVRDPAYEEDIVLPHLDRTCGNRDGSCRASQNRETCDAGDVVESTCRRLVDVQPHL